MKIFLFYRIVAGGEDGRKISDGIQRIIEGKIDISG
jgi:hypothetical protein